MFTRGYPKISEVWDDTLKFQWNDHWIPQKSSEYSGIDPTKNGLTLMINRFRHRLVDYSENQWIIPPSCLMNDHPVQYRPWGYHGPKLLYSSKNGIATLNLARMGETDAIWATYDLSQVWNTRDFWDDYPYTSHHWWDRCEVAIPKSDGTDLGGQRSSLMIPSTAWMSRKIDGFINHYPLVNIQIVIENGHRNSWFTHPLKIVIVHSYVCLP